MGASAKVIGADKAAASLRKISYNTASLGDAFEDIGDQFRVRMAEQFTSGNGWAPLSPVTIALRGGTSKPLVRFGKLMDSYVDTSSPTNIDVVGAQSARFGSGHVTISNKGKLVPTAAFHQGGTRHMPARPVKLTDPMFERFIVNQIADHIMGDTD